MNRWIELLENNDYIGVKRYLQDGADVNDANEQGESVLYNAMKLRCDEDLIFLLIENGADIYDFDEEGVGIFDVAITYNYIEVVRYFLTKNIDPNQTNRKSQFTPLMAAVCYGREEILKMLLENGADKELQDFKGFKAVDFARKMKKKNMLKLLNDEDTQKDMGFSEEV
ncbi:hypothetical protein MNB_SM-3-1339 [hydrothermal vent metagenome]|uniref:Uncharacterized protein n=1 Tax=hydrothermal vent metagenome TaxID=652676 RepID=A0A1W1D5B0_9ZZZZ